MPKRRALTLPEMQQLLHKVDWKNRKRKDVAQLYRILEATIFVIVTNRKKVKYAVALGTSALRQEV